MNWLKRLKMRSHGTSGRLITFCGLDGCGKTSMIRLLRETLEEQGSTVLITKQPTDFVRQSDIFRTYMDQENHDAYDYRSLSLLAASDRVQHVNKVVLPALERGDVVISDRYFYSCLANLRARGFERDRWIYDVSASILRPDLAFFLDVPVETAVERVRRRPEEKDRYIDMTLQYRLRDEYIRIARRNSGILLSTLAPKQETAEFIWEQVKKIQRREKDDNPR